MCFVVMMVNCAVIFISTSEVSGVGGRRVLILSVVWLSKIWISMRFVRVVFAAVCGDCPVFSTPTNPRVTLQTKLGWSGAHAVMVVVLFVFYRYFSCSFVSARGLRLSGAGGDVGVGYAVLIFEWLTRVARGSNFY